MKAVILAGGRGERLRPLTDKIPKPLIKIGNEPLLVQQILLLKRYGIKEIWVLSGYLGEKIKKHIGDGKKWHIKIHHLIEDELLGTAGAMKQLEGDIDGDFLVFSGDVILDIDLDRFIKFHRKHSRSDATIIVHPNDHPSDSDLVTIDRDNKVTKLFIRENKTQPDKLLFRNLVNAGVFILSPKIFKYIRKGERLDLEKDIFPRLIFANDKIYAYNTPEYIKDMGTLKRLKQVRSDYKSGKIHRFNKKNRRPAIFLDRDGVINDKSNEDVIKTGDFKLFPYSAGAIKKINQSDYLAIVITNQPAVARGQMTFGDLEMIHKKLETEIGRYGAKIDAIYFCPHHPEKGFEGEVKQLKINCNCRKPKAGLIKRAAFDFNIDLKASFYIGDSTVDAKCAKNAGVKFIGVETGYALSDGRYPISANVKIKNSLLEAVSSILHEKFS